MFKIEFCEKHYGFGYNGTWYDELVEGCDTPEQAVEVLKESLGDGYIYRYFDYDKGESYLYE